ncbi:SpoVR family protein, partial [Candidatus Poribacteria bacterium]|nr:SpoVR family protein [Candidatus Poribacteria bacterium]
ESNVPTIRITTRRGLTIEGAHQHRILMGNGQWKCLCDVAIGDEVAMNVAANMWASDYIKLDCQLSIDNFQFTGHPLHVGEFLDEGSASLIGYFIGDGHTTKSGIGFTCGSEKYARGLVYRIEEAFGLPAKMQWDKSDTGDESDTGGRWRVYVHSRELKQFFTALGINLSAKAPSKTVPSTILRSPKSVVAAFLRGYFDADAYAGPAGIILSSSSRELIRTVQTLLLNFGILSTQRGQSDGCIHLEIRGLSALRFRDEIGFDWVSKRQALEAYINSHQWYKVEKMTDEIVSIEHGRADVYDITVAQTHAYVANGFINHNSYWHSKIMSEKVLEASEVVDYADHFSGTLATGPGRINPYKLGYELLKDIEERWNKGKFGKDYEECDDYQALENWERKLGLGMEKLFEVRKLYNDVTFIDEFLTPEFVRRHKMFTYEYNRRTGMYEIANRSFDEIKKKLLFSLTNMGHPFIYVTDGNYKNRGELYLTHQHEGIDLDLRYSLDTLRNIQRIWGRPVLLETIESETRKLFRYDGEVYTVLT